MSSARLLVAGSILGLLGFLGLGLGLAIDPRQTYVSYFIAWIYSLSLIVGALCLLMITNAVGAAWFVVLRRLSESLVATLPLCALLFLPLLSGLTLLYPWHQPGHMETHTLDALERRRMYLNAPFFVVRSFLFLGTWSVFGHVLRHWSLLQDETGAPELSSRQRRMSRIGLPILGLTLTFASFDWLMSLTPGWYSTVFGVYVFAGSFVAGIALVIVLADLLQMRGVVGHEIGPSHYHALGTLLFSFVVFWAYIAYAQGFIVWIADVPEEVGFFALRLTGAWRDVGLLLVVGHFALPFFLLLSRARKHRPRSLAIVGAWMLLMHYVDMYWLIQPSYSPRDPVPTWLHLAAFLAVAGPVLAFGLQRQRTFALLPRRDPAFATSVRYRS